MKKKKCGKKRLPKYNDGVMPNYLLWNKANPIESSQVTFNTNYEIPNNIEPTGNVTKAIGEGWNNSIDRAGNRVAEQSNSGTNGISNIASTAMNALTTGIQTWSNPTLNTTPVTSMSSGPIKYEKTENINTETELNNLKRDNVGNAIGSVGTGVGLGAAIGSVVPGVGTVIGGAVGAIGGLFSGIFGASKRRKALNKQINNENAKIGRKNEHNLSTAHTDILQQDYLNDVNDSQNDILYNSGKTPFTDGKNANSYVGKGETIIDGITGIKTEVTSGSAVGTDDVPAIINMEDAVAGNKKNPRTGQTFAEDMKPLTRMENKLKRNTERNIKSIAANTEKMVKMYTQPLTNIILSEQAAVHSKSKSSSKPKYAMGKVAEYALQGIGELGTIAPSIYNIIQGTKRPDMVTSNNLYYGNPNSNRALSKMAKRRYNINPELAELRGMESRQRYNSRMLGTEGGVNRAMDIAGAINTQQSMSNLYSKKQNIDNQYLADEASMLANLGAQEATGKTQAMQQAYDINAKNKAMQQQYTAAGLQGLSQYTQLKQKNANQQKMDKARLRVLEKMYGMGTTQMNTDYILGGLLN